MPSGCACAERRGFKRDGRNKFDVVVACSMRLSHRFIGNAGSVEHGPAIKWFLKVRIALSAALRR